MRLSEDIKTVMSVEVIIPENCKRLILRERFGSRRLCQPAVYVEGEGTQIRVLPESSRCSYARLSRKSRDIVMNRNPTLKVGLDGKPRVYCGAGACWFHIDPGIKNCR